MKVTIVIPCRNEFKYIQSCIDHALKSDIGKSNLEIIVVDGKSDDGTFELLKKIENEVLEVTVIVNEKRMTPFAFNLGIKAGTGDFVVIAGARQFLAPNYISTCIQKINADDNLACCGGKINNVFDTEESRIIALGMDSPFGVGRGNFRILTKEQYVDTIGAPVFKRSIFDEIGFFDERLSRNQDDDFSYRLIASGKKILFTPDAQSTYHVRGRFHNLFRQYFQYGYWKVFVNKKHKTVTTLRQLFPLFLVLFLELGWIPSLAKKELLLPFLSIVGLYMIMALFFAFKKAFKLREVFSIIRVFITLHLAYGLGYQSGIIQFLLFRKEPKTKATLLSR